MNGSGRAARTRLWAPSMKMHYFIFKREAFLMVWSRDQGYRKQRYPVIGAYDRYSAKNL
jgi:hypothetical protein